VPRDLRRAVNGCVPEPPWRPPGDQVVKSAQAALRDVVERGGAGTVELVMLRFANPLHARDE
jgi:hypothetical protein